MHDVVSYIKRLDKYIIFSIQCIGGKYSLKYIEDYPIYDSIIKSKNISNSDLDNLVTKLVDIMEHITTRCMMCDSDLEIESVIPTICNKELCIFQYTQLGIGISLEYFTNNYREVSNFLLELYKETISVNVGNFMTDIPGFVSKYNDILGYIQIDNKFDINKYDFEIRCCLQWIITINRCQISYEPDNNTIPGVEQFSVISMPVEKEKVFQSNAKKYGTKLLFHGSPLHCWSSIIKNGLKNMSGTRYMVNGKAYGDGVYFSDDMQYALGYCGRRDNTKNKCIAMCEIVDRYKTSSPRIYVVTREEDIKIKYLFYGKEFKKSQ